jgi:hypothetical protein
MKTKTITVPTPTAPVADQWNDKSATPQGKDIFDRPAHDFIDFCHSWEAGKFLDIVCDCGKCFFNRFGELHVEMCRRAGANPRAGLNEVKS